MSLTEETTTTAPVIHQDFPCPGVTADYKIVVDSRGGYKIIANRRIKKGETIFKDSMEYMFSDVQEGDHMWLGCSHHPHHHHKASSKLVMDKDVPERIPVTRDMLLRTHGVGYVIKHSSEEVLIRTYLEAPTMFMNHSCDPTMHCLYNAEDIAARDLEVGDELTVDYAICDYEDVTDIGDCLCGAPSCRGEVLGFSSFSAEEKEKIYPTLSPPIIAEYLADIGQGPPTRYFDEMIPRPMVAGDGDVTGAAKVMRLMWPGPSWTEANNVVVKKDENTNQYGLYAAKNVPKGKRLYGFWRHRWPQGEKTLIDMVFAPPVDETSQEGDIQEGIVVRLDASKCGSYRNAKGQMMFDGWEMLNAHSCDPNAVYRNRESDENESWQSAFAAKDIKSGDRITMDWNCFTWDRAEHADMAVCHCGASNCVGTKQGFKHLSPEAQTERMAMTWLRKAAASSPSPENDSRVAGEPLGKALSPFVRAMSQQKGGFPKVDDATDTQSSTSASDSSSDSSDSEED